MAREGQDLFVSCHVPRLPSLLGQEVWADVHQPERDLGRFIQE